MDCYKIEVVFIQKGLIILILTIPGKTKPNSEAAQEKSGQQSIHLGTKEHDHIEQDDVEDCLTDFYQNHAS